MKKKVSIVILAFVMLGFITIAVSGHQSKKNGVTQSVLAKHVHQMGGPNRECSDCHNGAKAGVPDPLSGRYANMGGPNHQCSDCHNGEKAPLLPLPPEYENCADCHTKK